MMMNNSTTAQQHNTPAEELNNNVIGIEPNRKSRKKVKKRWQVGV